jgi:Tol biopolymer transport system component
VATGYARVLLLCLLAIVLPSRGATQAGPTVYQPGIFSTGAWDFFVALTPDQRTAYICRANGDFSYYTILETTQANGRWSEPRPAAFSGRWSDADPHVSPDGKKLFFISNRPSAGDQPDEEYDIWVVEREPGGRWGSPRNLGAPVNRKEATEWSPSVARNGNLYFGTIRDGGKGGNDLYLARWTGDRYAEPENLGDSVNTNAGEIEPWVAPDESYLIFSARGRPEGPGGFDLYLSERRNGVWQGARPLQAVNSPKGDFNHSVSPDGRYLFFSSTRGVFDSIPPAALSYAEMQRRLAGIGNGLGDIYRIPVSELGIRVAE